MGATSHPSVNTFWKEEKRIIAIGAGSGKTLRQLENVPGLPVQGRADTIHSVITKSYQIWKRGKTIATR